MQIIQGWSICIEINPNKKFNVIPVFYFYSWNFICIVNLFKLPAKNKQNQLKQIFLSYAKFFFTVEFLFVLAGRFGIYPIFTREICRMIIGDPKSVRKKKAAWQLIIACLMQLTNEFRPGGPFPREK